MPGLIALELRPDARKLRVFGYVACVVFGALAASVWWTLPPLSHVLAARAPLAVALLAAAVLCGSFSIVYPGANRPLYVALSLLAYPIGIVSSYALLALLFFGVFTPLGMLLRMAGKDPLQRRFDPRRTSYWTAPRQPRDKASYFRGF